MNDLKPKLAERPLPADCLSDLTLDRLWCGELDEQTSTAVELHLAVCERCAARARTLTEETQALSASLPKIDVLLGTANARRDASTTHGNVIGLNQARTRARFLAPALALVSAAAAMLLFLGRPDEPNGEIRLKGSGGVMDLYVRRGEEVFRWQDQPLQPGDQLRYSFQSAKPIHVAVLSRDAANTVTQYFPAKPDSWLLEPGVTLSPTATQLDATLGAETLWLVYCNASFTTDTLLEQLEHKAAIDPPAGCSTQKLDVVKENP